jgi:predicted Zn-dependent peptidase
VTVIAAGDGSHDELAALVTSQFGDWTASGTAIDGASALATPPDPATRIGLLTRSGAAQSELRMGHISVARSHPDYLRLLVLNMVLGGQFVSRVNMKLREEKGYTYGARTAFEARRGPGPFLLQASVQSDATVDAIRESIGEVSAIRGDRPVTRDELETGRAALTRGYPRNFETAEQVARAAAQMALHDLPEDYYSTFVPNVLALDETQVTEAAARHLDPSRLLTVIVGDPERFASDLESLALGTPLDIAPPALKPSAYTSKVGRRSRRSKTRRILHHPPGGSSSVLARARLIISICGSAAAWSACGFHCRTSPGRTSRVKSSMAAVSSRAAPG